MGSAFDDQGIFEDKKEEAEDIFEQDMGPKKYQSRLGDFSFQQEKLLIFGSSNKILIWVILELIILVANIILAVVTTSAFREVDTQLFVLFIIAFTFAILISAIGPVALLVGYTASRKLNARLAGKAVNVVHVYYKVSKAILIISAVLCGFMLFITLFMQPVVAIVLAIILGLVFFISLKFIDVVIEFLNSLKQNLLGHKFVLPNSDSLKTWVTVFLVLGAVSFFYDMVQTGTTSYGQLLANYPEYADLVNQIAASSYYSVVVTGIGLISTGYFLFLLSRYWQECYLQVEPKQ